MTDKTGILSLGTRADATTWEKGCKGLGFDAPLPIKKPSPSMDELKRFFASSFDWVFLAGHFGGNRLYNESGQVGVRFGADAVTLEVGSESVELKRGTSDLQLKPRLILWGGCSTLGNNALVRELATLFGNHTMIGFRAITGWKMVDAMLGAGFLAGKQHFFTRVEAGSTSAVLADAWMQTARLGYGGGTLENRFAAVEASGQRWILRDKTVVKDSKLF
jgi:hypothetical protein